MKVPLTVNAITVFNKVLLSFFFIKIEDSKIVKNKKIFINIFTSITLRSHEKVRSKINPKKYLKFIIHGPGFGRKFKKDGLKTIKKQGIEKPKEIKRKIKTIFMFEVKEAKPIAVPKKGALQGVAINVANIPEKK